MKNPFLYLFVGITLVITTACDKLPETFSGRDIDSRIIGTWTRTYMSKDMHNSMTIFQDTLWLGIGNQGKQVIYKFDDPDVVMDFSFYTIDTLFVFRPTGTEETYKRTYKVSGDSLTFGNEISYTKLMILELH